MFLLVHYYCKEGKQGLVGIKHNCGGSRVVQVISRNHSIVSKPAFVTPQVLYCSPRNQLSCLFYCLLSNKKKEKTVPSRYFVNHTAYPVLSERIRRVPRGWDCMVYGSSHKSLKTKFDWSETQSRPQCLRCLLRA